MPHKDQPEAHEAVTLDAPPAAEPMSTTDLSPAAGTIFGKYQLIEEVGRGGMGVVYKARQTDLDRIVALKMILAGQFADSRAVARFQAETRAAAKIQHPGVVGVLDVGEIAGQHFFTMPFVEGKTLAQVIADGSLSREEGVSILAEVARTVAFLHEQGIVHRDLKPANILLDRARRPLVTDFGLARAFEGDAPLTTTGLIAGTPSYMSPEQAAGERRIGPASDIYSLGAVLYATICGRPPFCGPTPLDTLFLVLEGEPIRPRNVDKKIPHALERICLRCLEKDPKNRYPGAATLAADLERVAAGDDPELPDFALWRRFQRWARSKPALAARVIGILPAAAIIQFCHSFVFQQNDLRLHAIVMALLFGWLAASVLFQQLREFAPRSLSVPIAWIAAEITVLTALFLIPQSGPQLLSAAFLFMIVSSGLWLQEAIVWSSLVLSLSGFVCLVWLRPADFDQVHYNYLFVAISVLTAITTAFQVRRMRILERSRQANWSTTSTSQR